METHTIFLLKDNIQNAEHALDADKHAMPYAPTHPIP
jgi:hypothetical protein